MNDAFGRPQSVVVLGGGSDIAGAILDLLIAGRCRRVVLAGRSSTSLAAAARRAQVGGADDVQTVSFDASDPTGAGVVVGRCFDLLDGQVDLVLCAVGVLGDQETDEVDPAAVAHRIAVNFGWPAAALAAVAERLRVAGSGRIVVLSSVAGMRVRRANFVYGSTKAGLDGFAQGLGEALRGSGVELHIVRPGFVHTKMTAGRPPAPFAVSPEAVAEAVVRGITNRRREIWVPSALQAIYLVARNLPAGLWRLVRQ